MADATAAYRYAVRHAVVVAFAGAGLVACSDEREQPETATLAVQAAVIAQWESRAPMPSERTEISVTTDGRQVFVIGGFAETAGAQRAAAPRAMHVYDPSADSWTTPDSIPQGVNHAGFAHIDNRLYIVGGFRENTFEPVASVRIYDPGTRQWSEGAPMPTPRGALAIAVVNGRIHAIGGNAAAAETLDRGAHHVGEDDSSVGTHEVYDPVTDTWQRLEPMPTARNHHGAAVLDGRIHVVAGRVGRNFEMRVHEVYDPATDSWTRAPEVPTGRSGIAVVVREGRMYVFGGETFADPARTFDEAERFDPAVGEWQALPPMPTARHGLGAAVVGGVIHVISGGPSPGFAFSATHEALVP
jgi:N-acetylneuraminic acid mutarotase